MFRCGTRMIRSVAVWPGWHVDHRDEPAEIDPLRAVPGVEQLGGIDELCSIDRLVHPLHGGQIGLEALAIDQATSRRNLLLERTE